MSNRLNAKHMAVAETAPVEETYFLNEEEIRRRAEAQRALYVGEFLGRAFSAIGRSLRGFLESVREARMMSELAQLDDRTLADIGIRRSDIPAYASGAWKAGKPVQAVDSVETEKARMSGRLAA